MTSQERVGGNTPGVIFSVTRRDIKAINRKYTFLFNRLFHDVQQAERPIAVVNRIVMLVGKKT